MALTEAVSAGFRVSERHPIPRTPVSRMNEVAAATDPISKRQAMSSLPRCHSFQRIGSHRAETTIQNCRDWASARAQQKRPGKEGAQSSTTPTEMVYCSCKMYAKSRTEHTRQQKLKDEMHSQLWRHRIRFLLVIQGGAGSWD